MARLLSLRRVAGNFSGGGGGLSGGGWAPCWWTRALGCNVLVEERKERERERDSGLRAKGVGYARGGEELEGVEEELR